MAAYFETELKVVQLNKAITKASEETVIQIGDDDDSDDSDIFFVSCPRDDVEDMARATTTTNRSTRRTKRTVVRPCIGNASTKKRRKGVLGTAEVQIVQVKEAATAHAMNSKNDDKPLDKKVAYEIHVSSSDSEGGEDAGKKTTGDSDNIPLKSDFSLKKVARQRSSVEIVEEAHQKIKYSGSTQQGGNSKKRPISLILDPSDNEKEEENIRRRQRCSSANRTRIISHPQTKIDAPPMNGFSVLFSVKDCYDGSAGRRKLDATKSDTSSSDHAMAVALQKSEEQSIIDTNEQDLKLAQKLQKEEEEHLHHAKHLLEEISEADTELAQLLQKEEDEKVPPKADPIKEQLEMSKSSSGKAVIIVQQVIELVQHVQKNLYPTFASHIDAVAIDDMVFLAEKVLEQQQEFKHANVPSHIDIGFHYTNSANMQDIRTNGLLTREEQKHQKVKTARNNGSVFGDGVYTANNPTSFQSYGDLGLLVGRLQGNRTFQSLGNRSKAISVHTIVGNKLAHGEKLDRDGWPTSDLYNEVVLRSSSQCLPMVKFDAHIVQRRHGKRCVEDFQASLQLILDGFVNDAVQIHE